MADRQAVTMLRDELERCRAQADALGLVVVALYLEKSLDELNDILAGIDRA